MSGDGRVVDGWIGEGTSFTGSVTWTGRVRVDGELVGDVTTPDLLELGPTGRLEGTARVAQALVAGVLTGRLIASERVTLLETARVGGEIETPWLDVRAGAQLDAKVKVIRG